jgi:CRISPR/Cas system-associated protein endoribonuclease Cas2
MGVSTTYIFHMTCIYVKIVEASLNGHRHRTASVLPVLQNLAALIVENGDFKKSELYSAGIAAVKHDRNLIVWDTKLAQ